MKRAIKSVTNHHPRSPPIDNLSASHQILRQIKTLSDLDRINCVARGCGHLVTSQRVTDLRTVTASSTLPMTRRLEASRIEATASSPIIPKSLKSMIV